MFGSRSSLLKTLFVITLLGASGAFILVYYFKGSRSEVASPTHLERESTNVKGASVSANPFSKLSIAAPSDTSSGVSPAQADSAGSSSQNDAAGNSSGSPNDSEESPNSAANSASVAISPQSSTLTASQQAVEDVTNVVVNDLKTGNFSSLYNLMSEEWKETLSVSQADFVSALSGSDPIASVAITSEPKIYGDNNEWAEQSVSFTLSSGSVQNYLNIYHQEGTGGSSAWTLFATLDE